MKPLTQCDETELKKIFVAALMPDFHIIPEFWGMHIAEQKPIRADYILRPKPHLVARGFDDVYIAGEVKAAGSIFVGSSTMWQCASYVQSKYGKTTFIRPAFGIVFPDMNVFSGIGNLILDTSETQANQKAGRVLEHIGQFMNVGFLELKPNNLSDWNIRIGAQRYFSKQYGKTKLNLIKRYIGNKDAA